MAKPNNNRASLFPHDDEFEARAATGGVNHAPVVNDEWATLRANTSVSANEQILLLNDSDPDGDKLSISSYTDPQHGTLTRAADGTLTYTPNAGYTGTDSFTYMVVDTRGACVEGTVTLNVLPAFCPPTIGSVKDDVGPVQGNVPKGGTTDDNRPTLSGTADPGSKVEVFNNGVKVAETTASPDGTWSATPAAPLPTGSNALTVVSTAADGNQATSAPYPITCVPGGGDNLAPIAGDDYVSLPAGTSISGHESVLLANDSDPEGGPLTIRSYTQPANGTLVRAADGTLTYTPKAGFSGTDSFTYTVVDNKGATDVGVVTLQVTPPGLGAPTVTIAEDRNNDGFVNRAELQGGIDVKVGLPSGAKAGDTVTATDDAGHVAGKVLTAGDIAAGQVTFPGAFPAPAEGATLTITAKLTDSTGASSPSASASIVLDTLAPATPAVAITTDSNNDGKISAAELSSHGNKIDLRVDLPGDARAGDTLAVRDQAGHRLDITLTSADIAARSLSLPGAFPVPADGQQLLVTAELSDRAGNVSLSGTDSAQISTSAPTPTVSLADDKNNDGILTRTELAGATRVDVRVDLPAGSLPGDLLQVNDNAGNGVSRTISAADIAAGHVVLADAFPLPAGGATITVSAKITDPAGNVSLQSTDSALFDANYAPIAHNDTASLRLGTAFPQVGGNVLANDTDADGPTAALQVAGVSTGPSVTPGAGVGQVLEGLYGHLSVNPDGSYTYVADKVASLAVPVQDVFYYLNKDGGNATSATPGKLTIQVDPALANVMSVSSPQAAEGEDLVYTIATSAAAAPTTVTLSLSGTATPGVDTGAMQVNFGAGWQDVVGGAVVVAPNTTSFQVRVPTLQDGLIENNETLLLKASVANGSSATGSGLICDDDMVSKVAGVEDTPLVLGWSNFTLPWLSGAQPALVIKSLPADGELQYNDGGAWMDVVAGQRVSKADIDAGKLRFVPDLNESGSNAYNTPGVGNQLNDYARFDYGVEDGSGTSYPVGVMQVDIAPKAEGVQTPSVTVLQASAYNAFPWAPGEWAVKISVNLAGAPSTDTDGSERSVIGMSKLYNAAQLPETVWTESGERVVPDADGFVWLNPGQAYWMSVVGGSYIAELAMYRQEVNPAGQVLDQVVSSTVRWSIASPLVLDLNGDGVQTVSDEHGVYFDIGADGSAERTGWTSAQDGLLVRDLDGNGRIDDGRELFGNGTVLPDGSAAPDGFAALAALDGNLDGKLSAADAGFTQLQVWQDANGDGVSQAGELHSLGSLGIVALNLAPAEASTVQNGNIIGLVSSYTTADGQTHELADVWFGGNTPAAPAAPLNAADLLSDGQAHNVDSLMGAAPAAAAAAPASVAPLPAPVHEALAQHEFASTLARIDLVKDHQIAA